MRNATRCPCICSRRRNLVRQEWRRRADPSAFACRPPSTAGRKLPAPPHQAHATAHFVDDQMLFLIKDHCLRHELHQPLRNQLAGQPRVRA
eukprot:1595269-Prymnesium_polylepis.1